MKCISMITLFYCREQCCATSEIINTANKRGRVADAEDRWRGQREDKTSVKFNRKKEEQQALIKQ